MSRLADSDLMGIGAYTLRTWGQAQAIRLGGAQAEPTSLAGTNESIPERAGDLRGKTEPRALRQ